MSLEKILEALETEVEGQVVALESRAKAEIEQIRARAQVAAEVARQKRLAAIQPPLQAEQARILNKAKLEALQVVLGTREELLACLFETATQRLAELANLEGYKRLLQQLLEEAVETLGRGSPLRLEVQKQDVALMQEIVQEIGLAAEVEGSLKYEGLWGVELGGVAVTTLEGQVRLVNTLEARLERAAQLYRTQIAALLFEQPSSPVEERKQEGAAMPKEK